MVKLPGSLMIADEDSLDLVFLFGIMLCVSAMVVEL